MSGRLIILPKKTYCPWNPSNVARVLRDEEEHAKAQEEAAARREQELSRNRLEALHRNKKQRFQEEQINDAAELGSREEAVNRQRTQQLEHVNLFAAEEKEQNKRLTEATRGGKDGGRKNNALYLGQSAKKAEDVFCLRKSRKRGSSSWLDQDEAEKERATQEHFRQKEERLKNRLDPMKEFVKMSHSHVRSSGLRRLPSSENEPPKGETQGLDYVPRTNKNRRRRDSKRSKLENDEESSSESDSSASTSSSRSSSSSCSSSSSLDRAEARRKRKKRRKRRDERRRRSKSSSDEKFRMKVRKRERKSNSTPSLDELRKRRAQREKAEQKRQETLMKQDEVRPRGTYHNQFFPGFSRK